MSHVFVWDRNFFSKILPTIQINKAKSIIIIKIYPASLINNKKHSYSDAMRPFSCGKSSERPNPEHGEVVSFRSA